MSESSKRHSKFLSLIFILKWDLRPENVHGRRELPNAFALNLLLTRTNGIYTQKVATGEEHSLMLLP